MTTDVSADLARISEFLRNANYRAQPSEEEKLVRSGAAGLKFMIVPRGRSVQFRCYLVIAEKASFGAAEASTFNRNYRFSKLYIDGDGDAVLEADHVIALDADDAEETFGYLMTLWEGSLGLMRDEINKAETRYDDVAEVDVAEEAAAA